MRLFPNRIYHHERTRMHANSVHMQRNFPAECTNTVNHCLNKGELICSLRYFGTSPDSSRNWRFARIFSGQILCVKSKEVCYDYRPAKLFIKSGLYDRYISVYLWTASSDRRNVGEA